MKPAIRVLIDLAPGWRLGADPLQWIVLKWRPPAWRAIAFVASNKQVLNRVLTEYGIQLSSEARTYIDHLPERFRVWAAEMG